LRLYADLLTLEGELRRTPADPSALSRLDALDHRVHTLHLPISFGEMTYALRMHIRSLRDRLSAAQ